MTRRVRHHAAASCTMNPGNSASRSRAKQRVKPRRCGLTRLRSAFFARAGDAATRYSVTFEQVLRHLWAARRSCQRLMLRMVTHIEDLVLAIGCLNNDGRAWSDLTEHYERSLARRGRHSPEDVETTVQARRFIAALRRDALSNRCALSTYAGTRPLRSWLGDVFTASRQRTRRAAFVLDPADSCCGMPLRFTCSAAE